MSLVELEELSDALSFYFWLLVWAPRILERASILSKSPRQVHSNFSSSGSLLCCQISILMLLQSFSQDGWILIIFQLDTTRLLFLMVLYTGHLSVIARCNRVEKFQILGTRNNGPVWQNIMIWLKRSFLGPKRKLIYYNMCLNIKQKNF